MGQPCLLLITSKQRVSAFHSTKKSGLNFRQLPLANGTAFSKFFKKRTTLLGIPKFLATFSDVLSSFLHTM